jgi:hypothetical protein
MVSWPKDKVAEWEMSSTRRLVTLERKFLWPVPMKFVLPLHPQPLHFLAGWQRPRPAVLRSYSSFVNY